MATSITQIEGSRKRPISIEDDVDDLDDSNNNQESPPRKFQKADQNISLTASPFELNAILGLPSSDNEDCITLKDILHDPDLSGMLQLNFTIDFDFLWNHIHPSCRNSIPITIFHGMRQSAQDFMQEANKHSNVKAFTADTPIPFGTHHTKAMILFRHENSQCQCVIHTANLLNFDWENTTQCVWRSKWVHLKSTNEVSPSSFENDLVFYLSQYRRMPQNIIQQIKRFDWSSITATIIASIPGRFASDMDNWGHMRLRKILSEKVKTVSSDDTVICQFSSIGSLGKTDSWLKSEFGKSLGSSKMKLPSPQIKLIFPTVDNIKESLNGWYSGTAIHYNKKATPEQTKWMRQYLHKWHAIKSGRHMAAPHIKTYMRLNSDLEDSQIRWILMTSANLSKAAWGSLEKLNSQLFIRSWELGVLVSSDEIKTLVPTFKMSKTQQKEKIPIRMAYDLPLVPYSKNDEIWSPNVSYSGEDIHGQPWPF